MPSTFARIHCEEHGDCDFSGCTSTITNAIQDAEGLMGQISFDVKNKRVYLPGVPSLKDILEKFAKAGFEAVPLMDDILPEPDTPAADLQLVVDGMTCHSCTEMVKHGLSGVKGVEAVLSVSLETKLALIKGHPDPQECITALEDFGFEVKVHGQSKFGSVSVVEVIVEGMTCGACTQLVANALKDVKGVSGAIQVDLKTKIAKIPGTPSVADCIIALENFGFTGKEKPEITSAPATDLNISLEEDDDITFLMEKKKEPKNKKQLKSSDRIMIDESADGYDTIKGGLPISSEFHIEGMTCASCVALIETLLSKVPGVVKTTVNLLASKAVVSHVPSIITAPDVAKEITGFGYPAREVIQRQPGKLILEIDDIEETDISAVTRVLDAIPGITSTTVSRCLSHEHFIATLSFDPAITKARDIIKEGNKTVYRFSYHPFENNLDALNRTKEIEKYKWLMIISLIFTIPTFIIAMILMMIPALHMTMMYQIVPGLSVSDLLLWILATPMQFWVGKSFYINSWISLKKLSPTMDVLIALGTSAAYFSSMIGIIYAMVNPNFKDIPQFFETAVFLIAFVMIGRFLENHAKSQTSQAISKLFGLQATEATLLVTGKEGITIEETIDVHLIEVGDHLKVVPGEKIPCDGKVIFGKTYANEAMITGESMPVKKQPGDLVIGSTINQHGLIHIEASKVGSDTALSQIIKLVEDAQGSKGETQKLADTISGYFVPFVIALSLITFSVWDVLTGLNVVPDSWLIEGTNGITFSLLFGITVLVIACPCALGLATPTAVMVGTGLAAKYHILIKGGEVLDKTYQVNNILFDKTGTLTIGEPKVTDFLLFPESGLTDQQFWSVVGSSEAGSEHPLGICIYKHAKKNKMTTIPVTNFKAISGMGIRCTQNGKTVLLGNRRLMKKYEIEITKQTDNLMEQYEEDGKTAMLVAVDKILCGVLAVSDPIRPESQWVVEKLNEMGIKVSVISGDNAKTVKAIARHLKIDKIFAEVLPKDKKDKVHELQEEGYCVAMVGDGINDSPALAQADVGIAIGTGTDIAMESAGIVLMRSRLTDILTAVDISKRTSNRIKLNFVWAFLYNILAIPIAAGVFYPLIMRPLPPWIAGLAMALSSISVLLSSLLLRWYTPPEFPNQEDDLEVTVDGSDDNEMVHLDSEDEMIQSKI